MPPTTDPTDPEVNVKADRVFWTLLLAVCMIGLLFFAGAAWYTLR